MEKIRIALLALLSVIMVNVYPQISCEIIGDTITPVRSEETNRYIPDAFTPIKTIKMNFHFMLKSDSTLNFPSLHLLPQPHLRRAAPAILARCNAHASRALRSARALGALATQWFGKP